MTTNIKYTRNGSAQGRNGTMKVTGMEVMVNDICPYQVMLTPINTKGIGNCYISIPTEDIWLLIDTLTNVAKGIGK